MDEENIKKEIRWAINDYYNGSGIVYGSELICGKCSLDLPRVNGEFISEEIIIKLIKRHTLFKLFSKNKKIDSYIDIKIKREFTFISGTTKYKSYKCYDKQLCSELERLFSYDLNEEKNKNKLRDYDLFESDEASN
jgi:hypothetical protein